MEIKQNNVGKGLKNYSELTSDSKVCHYDARPAARLLLSNGYTLMNGFYINEIVKLIRTLRELKVEYTMNTFEDKNVGVDAQQMSMKYEFTTIGFIDDRR